MGSDNEDAFPHDGEGPVREVVLSPFRIDRHTVTNASFGRFTEATRYRTEAERFGWSTYSGHKFRVIAINYWWRTLSRQRRGGAKCLEQIGTILQGLIHT
jgi:formylglycine-generating enzyme required for sulfatase activity